jgi:hypothetical protein
MLLFPPNTVDKVWNAFLDSFRRYFSGIESQNGGICEAKELHATRLKLKYYEIRIQQ